MYALNKNESVTSIHVRHEYLDYTQHIQFLLHANNDNFNLMLKVILNFPTTVRAHALNQFIVCIEVDTVMHVHSLSIV